jgi:O-antigen ligase
VSGGPRTATTITAVVVAGATAVLCPLVVLLPELTSVDTTVVVAGVVVLGLLVVVAALRGPEDLGVAMLVASAGTAPWNAVTFHGAKLGPSLLLGATVMFAVPVLAGRTPLRVRPWTVVLGSGIAAVAVLTWFLPPDANYFASRYVGDGEVQIPSSDQVAGISTVAGLQWLVAAVVLPVVVTVAAKGRPWLAARLADAWTVGASVSAGVAVSDELGLTHLSASLLPFVDVGGRQAGLSVQPNHVAVAAALTVPIAVWRLTRGDLRRPRLHRAVAAVCLALIAGGLVVSASRGALVIAVLAAVAVLLTTPGTRRLVAPLVAAALLAAVLVVAAVPGLLGSAAETLRLTGAESADASDAVRAAIGAQAWQDFLVSPLHGIGLEVAVQGHDIYLQLLASGGGLLLLAFVAAIALLALDVAGLLRRPSPGTPPGLVAALALAVVTWLVVCSVENHLTDLFLYVPLAVLAALRSTQVSPQTVPDPDPDRAVAAPDAPPAAVAVTAEGPRA